MCYLFFVNYDESHISNIDKTNRYVHRKHTNFAS